MNTIQSQEAKVEKLRKQYKECTSVAYKQFIKASGILERQKLDKMKLNVVAESEPLF